MFLNSSKLHFSRGFTFVFRRRQHPMQQRGCCGKAQVYCTYAESAAVVQSSSDTLESSVVPSPFTQFHTASRSFTTTPPLAYEVLQGSLVRHCDLKSVSPPTIVLVHGILGSKKNLHAFAKRLLEGFPAWQAVLVDLPCHGDSHCLRSSSHVGSHNVTSAARDILQLLNYLKLFPRVLIGHSFGGKVVMSMAHQFGQTLPRPVQAWVLDTLPGEVSAGPATRQDHPFDLIKTLQSMPLPVSSRSSLIQHLVSNGFSQSVANWMTTNLRTRSKETKGFTWAFDLDGVEQLYRSYETSSLWPLLYSPPEGLSIDFVRAEHSHFRWTHQIQNEIESLGHRVHVLKDAGHWVHADNPEGLYSILRASLGSGARELPQTTFA